jgi:hypothetical protein
MASAMDYSAMNKRTIVSSLTQRCFLFSSGIGTRWKVKGLATSETTPPCAYTGALANKEYKAISGCSAVPLEKNRGPGGDCGHWSEECMKDELMTPLISGNNQLSRITVGSLEDLGYVVDYSHAAAFGRTDLGTAPSCTCNRRSLLDVHHNETRPLGLGRPDDTVRRVPSADALQFAIDFGKKILAANALPPNVPRDDGTTMYVADEVVSVAFWTGGEVMSVVVHGQN